MLKFLLISFLIFFIVYKLLKFFFKLFLVKSAAQFQQRQYQSSQNYQQRYQKPREGNINIDYIPKQKKEREEKSFKGGEYIDYEEVK